MPKLLRNKNIMPPDQGKKFNLQNGSDAEKLAASTLIQACSGEIGWGSREEDGRKIDIFLSYEHPWRPKERIIILTQIKSGEYFGSERSDGFTLKRSGKSSALRTSHSICVVWVSRNSNKCFWSYLHPNSSGRTQQYGDHHMVTPALRYDLARCHSRFSPGGMIGGRGLIVSKKDGDLKARRKHAKKKYEALQMNGLFSPVLGDISVTRLGWRHMFRASRKQEHKSSSLDAIPILEHLLPHVPTSHHLTSCTLEKIGDNEFRTAEHLLKFSSIDVYDRENQTLEPMEVVVRLLEEVRYPVNWASHAMLRQTICRKVGLLACYIKVRSSQR